MSLRDIQNLNTISADDPTYHFRTNRITLDDGIKLTESNLEDTIMTQYNTIGGPTVFRTEPVGGATSLETTVWSTRIGTEVIVSIGAINYATSAVNGNYYITNLGSVLLPSWHRPLVTKTAGCQVQNNGVNSTGVIMVLPTGEIRIYYQGVVFPVTAPDSFGLPEGTSICYTTL
jgi:hypothetical protein